MSTATAKDKMPIEDVTPILLIAALPTKTDVMILNSPVTAFSTDVKSI